MLVGRPPLSAESQELHPSDRLESGLGDGHGPTRQVKAVGAGRGAADPSGTARTRGRARSTAETIRT